MDVRKVHKRKDQYPVHLLNSPQSKFESGIAILEKLSAVKIRIAILESCKVYIFDIPCLDSWIAILE